MKKLNNVQSNYKAKELDHEEINSINGGFNPWALGAADWLGNEIVQNWEDIKKGMSEAQKNE